MTLDSPKGQNTFMFSINVSTRPVYDTKLTFQANSTKGVGRQQHFTHTHPPTHTHTHTHTHSTSPKKKQKNSLVYLYAKLHTKMNKGVPFTAVLVSHVTDTVKRKLMTKNPTLSAAAMFYIKARVILGQSGTDILSARLSSAP